MFGQAIFKKEWIKLRWTLPALGLAALGLGFYFYFRLKLDFLSVEPESMMWYRFSQLEDKPYAPLAWFYLLCAATLALVQFLPETIRNRARILLHLPIPAFQMTLYHVGMGSLFLLFPCVILCCMVLVPMSSLYPAEIVHVTLKDLLFWLLPAFGVYLGLGAAIIERKKWKRAVKLVFALGFALFFLKERYEAWDLLGLLAILWLGWSLYDSFLGIKSKSSQTIPFQLGYAVFILFIAFSGVETWQKHFSGSDEKFYIFYSPVRDTFVYQKNGIGHQFEYGTKVERFDKAAYEAALPFIFWKDLDIQGKLPVTIHDEVFDKERIQSSRLSLQYDPSLLETHEVALYPFFNPQSHLGVIAFPEESLVVKKDGMRVYDSETARVNEELTEKVNRLLKEADVAFPVGELWGKTTNMKPFDWGYFFKDKDGGIFNLRRQNNVISLNKFPDEEAAKKILFMRISENRQQNFYGYAITEDNRIFLVSYPDYELIPLPIEGFDYKKTRLQLLADPMYYLVRSDDGTLYMATLFDKNYRKLDSIEFR